ncbi:MAG: hypothetical protein AAGA03_09440, partial [Planctomycetota bacterium]
KTIVGRGGTGQGYLDADGRWVNRAELTAVDAEGTPIQPVESSYAAPVPLDREVSVDAYLSHAIRSLYGATPQGDSDAVNVIAKRLQAGTIFQFPYSFRGGLEADAGFLLADADGQWFIAIGSPTKPEFIGLQQWLVESPEDEAMEDLDAMDFDMI